MLFGIHILKVQRELIIIIIECDVRARVNACVKEKKRSKNHDVVFELSPLYEYRYMFPFGCVSAEVEIQHFVHHRKLSFPIQWKRHCWL